MFLKEFESRLLKNSDVSFDAFPYYIDSHTQDLLISCTKAQLLDLEFTKGLPPSDFRILIHGPADSQIYQENLVKALANHLGASFLLLNGSVLSPLDLSKDEEVSDHKKPEKLEKQEKSENEDGKENPIPPKKLRKGNWVKFVGDSKTRHNLTKGQRGIILSPTKGFSKDVAVKFTTSDECFVEWCSRTELELEDDPATNESTAAFEALREIAEKHKPLIVYITEVEDWPKKGLPSSKRREFFEQVEEQLAKFPAHTLFIASIASKSAIDEDLDLDWRPFPTRIRDHDHSDIYKLFGNTVNINPPEDDNRLKEWNEQLKKDKKLYISRRNIQRIERALEFYDIESEPLSNLDTLQLKLSVSDAENVVKWALNHYKCASNGSPSSGNGKLCIPLQSFEQSIAIMKAQKKEKAPATSLQLNLDNLDLNMHERRLTSTVICKQDIGVLFSDIGALEDAKKALKELIILPLQRPELFKRGNLTKPCRGVLLFGPPGTGKTLLAKAVATEAGANFMNVSASTLTSMWYGEAEKQAKAVFTLAKKIAPVVIFVDEVDSILGVRGGRHEHEATRRVKNEFMAAWDGLSTKPDERIMVLAATNRPFDLDDAVIRRLPRRILIDLPQEGSRVKILEALLVNEKLDDKFDINELAKVTHGYSGSDLKNLCVAAAHRPIRDLLAKEEQQGCNFDGQDIDSMLRALSLQDFIDSMSQVAASVPYDAPMMRELRNWNEMYGEGGRRKITVNSTYFT